MSNDLERELNEQIREGLGGRAHRTLEEALQDALDNTTPERPGDPRDKKREEPFTPEPSQWLL